MGKKIQGVFGSAASEFIVGFVVGVDPSSDWSLDQYEALAGDPRVSVVQGAQPGGKANSLNAAEGAAPPSDFLLIVDTSQSLADDAIVLLVRSIRRAGWAGASGIVVPEAQGMAGRLWQWLELGIRSGQAAARGLVTTSGAITMLRRDDWRTIPSGTICDDLFLTMGAAARGGKVGLCTDAVAVDPRRVSPREGFGKRVRTLTGLWQYILVLDPSCLNPLRNRLWVDFVLHKIMRILTPFLFVVAVATGTVGLLRGGWDWPFGPVWVWLVLAGVTIALALLSEGWRWRLATLFSPVLSTWNALRGNWNVWDVSKD